MFSSVYFLNGRSFASLDSPCSCEDPVVASHHSESSSCCSMENVAKVGLLALAFLPICGIFGALKGMQEGFWYAACLDHSWSVVANGALAGAVTGVAAGFVVIVVAATVIALGVFFNIIDPLKICPEF